MSYRKMFAKGMLSALLSVSLLAGVATPARADRDDREEKCRKHIHKAEESLEKAKLKHGEHSRQAEDRRHHLEEVRERCRFRDRDHDHDHDHDQH